MYEDKRILKLIFHVFAIVNIVLGISVCATSLMGGQEAYILPILVPTVIKCLILASLAEVVVLGIHKDANWTRFVGICVALTQLFSLLFPFAVAAVWLLTPAQIQERVKQELRGLMAKA